MKISASVYSAINQDLPNLLKELEGLQIDFLHIDCFEGDEEKFLEDLKLIRELSSIPIDLHAISSDSAKYLALAEDNKLAQLTLQFENLQEAFVLSPTKSFKFGLALVNETDLEALVPYREQLDYVLLMTTTPGKSGGQFKRESFERIRRCKALFPDLPIYVDGGINAEVSFILRLLGVSLAVSGSFLVNHKNMAQAFLDLRFNQNGSSYLLEDFMIAKERLPILHLKSCTFKEVLLTMETYKMGFVLFERDGHLEGISSNADLRRGILKHVEDLNKIEVEDVVNRNPIKILGKASSYEMLSLLKSYKFPILFLPVVNEENKLLGALSFNELIKGEA
ncbi:MAG: hypothetical protein H6579_01730 [Chitinophagales bacterium]|nr:hypothetical protein [Chitinophagales bacterium]